MKILRDEYKIFEMDENYSKWMKILRNGLKSFEMDENSLKCRHFQGLYLRAFRRLKLHILPELPI